MSLGSLSPIAIAAPCLLVLAFGELFPDGARCAEPKGAEPPAKTPKDNGGPKEKPAAKTGFVFQEVYLRHKTTEGHPERPQRLTAIVDRLRMAGLLPQLEAIALAVDPAEWIETIHSPEYVKRVKASFADGVTHLDSRDTPISKESYDAAVAAVAGVLSAADAVVAGKAGNAFCAVRPPGHHALKDKAMGFCIFNNIAIAARYVQKKHKLAKVLIVDWDVHHGNGTQAAFDDDPAVMYFSVHRHPFYPGTGKAEDKGTGKGEGSKVNVPLEAGSGDKEYRKALEEKLVPAALAFQPDFVLVSAGFDAHEKDPLGGMKVTAQGYADLTRIVKGIADKCCGGRLVSVLEGGYDLDGLADSVEGHIRVLRGEKR